MRLQRSRHVAEMVDDDGGAGVGGAQHRPLELERTQPRDVQVLVDCDRLAEPADVAQVDEHRRGARFIGEARGELLAEQVFVADVRCDALAIDDERWRVHRAAVEVAEGDVHQAREPLEAPRNEFAEGH